MIFYKYKYTTNTDNVRKSWGADFMPLALEIVHETIFDSCMKLLKKLASDAADHIDIPDCMRFSY
jgi:hypothetical protein